MGRKVIIALDQGTTSSRAVVFGLNGEMMASCSVPFEQLFPKPGHVEHRPGDLISSQIQALKAAVEMGNIPVSDIAAIGITNQRETTLVWDRRTGECVHNAIVWQCRRTASEVERLKAQGYGPLIIDKTGLLPDAYFSATKIKWLLDTLILRERAQAGGLCFGTVDSFLAWHLLRERPHVTDATNAARTMLFNIHTQDWDEDLLHLMDIPRAMLPKVIDTAAPVGTLDPGILGRPIPVTALAGDQHASLFGQACFEKGMMKNTYGTGCFMLMNTGHHPVRTEGGLLTTLAWRLAGKPVFALEGSVFMGGATLQWLRDEMGLLATAAESEALALEAKSNGGVYLVPAHTGLGAPWWDMYSRGTIVGLTRGTGRAHVVRAALEAIAYQSYDLMEAMRKALGQLPSTLKVDGGASANAFLMQFQADIAGIPVVRPKVLETTALGAAMLAGLGAGLFKTPEETAAAWQADLVFTPQMPRLEADGLLKNWHRAVDRSLCWIRKD